MNKIPTSYQEALLFAIDENPLGNLGTYAKELDTSSFSVATLIAGLEREGWIDRTVSARKEAHWDYAVTAKGVLALRSLNEERKRLTFRFEQMHLRWRQTR